MPIFTADRGACDAGVCGGTLVHEAPSLQIAPGPDGPWVETHLLGWPPSSPLSTQGAAQNLSTDLKLRGLADIPVP